MYDILGRQFSVLVNERRDTGIHEVKFDASELASGVYFYRLQRNEEDYVEIYYAEFTVFGRYCTIYYVDRRH